MGSYDLSGSGGYSLNGGSGGVFGNALTADTAATPNGVFDYFERGVGLLSGAFTAYQNARYSTPERVVEYDSVPRDISGEPVFGSGGLSLSWQLIALAALAAFGFIALKGK